MRRNRHKQVRKALRFYKINHGFKVPFKVLVDGNFVNALLELKRGRGPGPGAAVPGRKMQSVHNAVLRE